jgi:hypothetical protein
MLKEGDTLVCLLLTKVFFILPFKGPSSMIMYVYQVFRINYFLKLTYNFSDKLCNVFPDKIFIGL